MNEGEPNPSLPPPTGVGGERGGESRPAAPAIDWKNKRIAPHWSLLVAALLIFAFLLDSVRQFLNPLTMAVAILLLLYPSRRIRAIKPLLFLALMTALISLWWRLHALLIPFVISFALAYAFDPTVEWCVRRGLPRIAATLLLVLGLIGLMIGGAILIIPRLVDEVGTLAVAVPQWVDTVRQWVIGELLPWVAQMNVPTERIWEEIQPRLPAMLKTLAGGLADWGVKALSGIMGLITGIANLIIIPVLTIYFLNDFRRLRRLVFGLFPDDFKPDALVAYRRLNLALSAFIRGQLLVCLFLAAWIGTGLALVAHLPYAVLLGAAAGFLNLIPYVGTTTALIVTLAVAMFQPSPVPTAIKALIVFVSAQTLEGNLLTPRIVGDKVGLHPLVVIFVVLLFATLFGLVGMLIAIPVAASARVLWEVAVERRRRIAANFTAGVSAT